MTTVHTYPTGDLIEHNTDGGDCPCGPTVEAVFREDGSNGWHVIHHSLDGREQRESDAHYPPGACGICGRPLNEVGTSRCYEAHGHFPPASTGGGADRG